MRFPAFFNRVQDAVARMAGWWLWPTILVCLIIFLILGNAYSLQRLERVDSEGRKARIAQIQENRGLIEDLQASQARQDRVIASINVILNKATPGVQIRDNGDILIDPKSKNPLAEGLRRDPQVLERNRQTPGNGNRPGGFDPSASGSKSKDPGEVTAVSPVLSPVVRDIVSKNGPVSETQ